MSSWLSVQEVSERKGESERTVRYRCEKGAYPALKDEEGRWRISPALFGESGGVLRDAMVSHCIAAVVVPGEGLYVRHPLPGTISTWFQWASGTPCIVFSRATSGQASLIPLGAASGINGYLWLATE